MNLISTHFLNYSRKLSDQIGVELGPNMFGEMFTVVEQEYDESTGKTRLGLALSRVING